MIVMQESHYRKHHYLCEEATCRAAQFIVFDTLKELNYHRVRLAATPHGPTPANQPGLQVMEHPELAGTRVLPVEFSVGDGRRREYYAADGRRVVEDDDDADARADAIAAVAASYPAPVPTAADFPALPGADQAPIPRPLVPRSRRHAATSSRRRARAPAMKPEDFPALGGGGGQRRYDRCVHSVQGPRPGNLWSHLCTGCWWLRAAMGGRRLAAWRT